MTRRVFLAGHCGMVGSAMLRLLVARRDGGAPIEIVTADRHSLDLGDQMAVSEFLSQTRPDEVLLAAARVGGIAANSRYPADFILENLSIQTNVIAASHRLGIGRLLFLGSSCIYPREAPQPIDEASLLAGPLEPTNAPYAVAKIAGLVLCDSLNRQYGTDYRAAMPTNLYGPEDNFDVNTGHVLPALLRKFHEAKGTRSREVAVWGTGRPRREFLHVDDLAAGALFVHDLPIEAYRTETAPQRSHLNIGTGHDITIRELAEKLSSAVGFEGHLRFDPTKPDGTPRKVLSVERLSRLGWKARIPLHDGIAQTYRWYCETHAAKARQPELSAPK